jgi:hypothetical protein
MIEVASSCGKKLCAPDDKAGKEGRCPHCGTVVVVPNLIPVDRFRHTTFGIGATEDEVRKADREGRLSGPHRLRYPRRSLWPVNFDADAGNQTQGQVGV